MTQEGQRGERSPQQAADQVFPVFHRRRFFEIAGLAGVTAALASCGTIGQTSPQVLHFVERARQEGSAVLFISHNIFHSHQVADRIVIMDRGRIAAQMGKDAISAIELTELMQNLARGREVLARKGEALSLEETSELPSSQTDRRSPA